jgi:cell division protease FtsH
MEDRDYSEEVAQAIDEEVRNIMESNYQRAKTILESNRDKLESVSAALMEIETLDREAFLKLMQGAYVDFTKDVPPPMPPPKPPVMPDTDQPRPRIEPRLRPEPGPA